MLNEGSKLKAIRRHCLECSGDSPKAVLWCGCDGRNSTACELWKFRFGVQPSTFRAKFGDRLLSPSTMPPADLELDRLPGTLEAAALGAIDVDGYHQPAIVLAPAAPRREMSPERRAAVVERFRMAREARGQTAPLAAPANAGVH